MKNSLKIALLEDDDDDQLLFKEAIDSSAIPVELTIFNDGLSLVKELKSEHTQKFDFIFLDVNAPKIDGIECLKQIKEDKIHHETDCIVLTTVINEELAKVVYETGAKQLIKKPDSFEEFEETIKHIIDK